MASEAQLLARVRVLKAEMATMKAPVAQQHKHVAKAQAVAKRAQAELSEMEAHLAEMEAQVKRKRDEVAEAERELAQYRASWEAKRAKVAGTVVAQNEAAWAAYTRKRRDLEAQAEQQLAQYCASLEAQMEDPAWRDWAGGLPAEVLAKIAEKVVAQTEAGWAAQLKGWGNSDEEIEEEMAERKRDGNCLFVFARVCKQWRKAQLKVGGPLRTQVWSDVIAPGSVALAKWALAEGYPTEMYEFQLMASLAASHGRVEMVKWLCGEDGRAMDEGLMKDAASSGNLELVRWLRGEGCPWDIDTCYWAVKQGHVEVLRWLRENGAPWTAATRDEAAAELGYTDDLDDFIYKPL